ncbi:MAG: EF-hand domain-containing protein [Thermoguttaceae bacterium]
MTHSVARLGITLVAIVFCASFGCSAKSRSRAYPPAIDPNAAQKAMELYDSDKDGFLDKAELEKVPGLKAAIEQVDTNHDGKISADEISARIESWKASRTARMPIRCVILHKGQPLVGATITFVPESFLGNELPTVSATTGLAGGTAINAPAKDGAPPIGLPPGFYRVQVTKSGENIPAKYNTATTLGQEVANDAKGLEPGKMPQFDLDY